jgi:hypothetical protein
MVTVADRCARSVVRHSSACSSFGLSSSNVNDDCRRFERIDGSVDMFLNVKIECTTNNDTN